LGSNDCKQRRDDYDDGGDDEENEAKSMSYTEHKAVARSLTNKRADGYLCFLILEMNNSLKV
jgi:hypothetical protein